MSLEEFEAHYREAIDVTLNQLQTATLMLAQIEAQIAEIGSSVQSLSQTVEEFIIEQRNK